MSVLHTLVSVALAPATTPWGTTPAFAHLNICRWTEGTTAWVCKLSSLLQLHEYQTVWGPDPVLCIFFLTILTPMLSGRRAHWLACSIQGLLLPNRAHWSFPNGEIYHTNGSHEYLHSVYDFLGVCLFPPCAFKWKQKIMPHKSKTKTVDYINP